jgi:PAS domain S-box-containing protein
MKLKIVTKLTLWFLLIALLPLTSAGYVVYVTAEKRLRRHIEEDLSKISADKARRIEAYFIERRKDGITLSRAPWVIDALEQLNYAFHRFGVGSPAYRVIDDRINAYLSYFREAYGYDNLHFVSANGNVIYSVVRGKDVGVNLNTAHDKDSALAKVVGNANMLLQAENSSFGIDWATGMPAVFVAAPVFKKGKLIGTLALELSNRELSHLAEDYKDLGETGETVIGQRMNDMAVIVAPLRHDPKATFRRRVALGSAEAQALQDAVQGKSGRGVITDYRGKEVLAVWRYLPNARYGVVVKIDAVEMLAPIRDLRNLSLITGSVTILLVALIALFAAKSFSVPVRRLTEAAESIAQGDLTRRIDATSHDEIGQLATTFNKMAARLQERTEALKKTAEELRFGKENLELIVQDRTCELRNQQEYYQSLLENSSDIVTILAADALIRYESPSIERILGYRPDELVAKPAFNFVHPEDASRFANFLQDALKQPGVPLSIELRFRHRDSSWRNLESVGNNQLHNPAVGGIIVNSRDISDRKIAEQERADFASMIAHDLRSPLSNVIGVSEMIADSLFGSINDDQKKWLNKVTGTARRLVDLVSDFLDVSKLEAGRIDLTVEEVDLEKLLNSAIDNNHFQARDRKIALRTNVNLPMRQIRADPGRLDQVLNNLLSNALKFTPEGGTVTIGAKVVERKERRGRQGDQETVQSPVLSTPHSPDSALPFAQCDMRFVEFSVQDTGVGIPLDELGQLFEKYRQTSSGKISAHKGTGLGLVICKMIVEAHGGRIWAESELGRGTTFTFTLG